MTTTKYSDSKLKDLRAQLATAETGIKALDGKLAVIARKDEVSQADLVQRENLRRQRKKLAGQAEGLEAAIATEAAELEAKQRKASEGFLLELGVRIAQSKRGLLERAAELEAELKEKLDEYEQLRAEEARAYLDLHGRQAAQGFTWFRGAHVRATSLERVGSALAFDREQSQHARNMQSHNATLAEASRRKVDPAYEATRPAAGDSKVTLERKANQRRALDNKRGEAERIAAQREEQRAVVEEFDSKYDDESTADAGPSRGEEA